MPPLDRRLLKTTYCRHVAVTIVAAIAWLGSALDICIAAPTATAPTTQSAGKSRWFQVLIEGQPSGWMRSRQGNLAADHVESETTTSLSLRRGPVTIEIEITSTFSESADGVPLRAVSTQKLGGPLGMAVVSDLRFTREGIVMTTRQGGQERREQIDNPTDPEQARWLPPRAAERFVAQRIAEGAKEISYWTIDPGSGPRPIKITMTRVGPANVEVMGKTVPATQWDQTVSIMPHVVSQAYLDDQGIPLRTTTTVMPGMTMTMIAAEEALARAKVNPPELVAATLIEPDRAIEQPRRVRRAVYRLSLRGSGAATRPATSPATRAVGDVHGIPLVVTDSQRPRADRGDADATGAVVIEVDVDMLTKASPRPGPEYFAASTALNHQDPAVRKLADSMRDRVGMNKTRVGDAMALRRLVHEFIKKKDLSVGMATAGDVARTGEGDCTEHAMLLAAILRAEGIPSRVVTGLVYADEFLGRRGVFGYHMWTEAWFSRSIDNRTGMWVPLDATLGDGVICDATHIALSTSAMRDGEFVYDMVGMAGLIGRLSIQVVETSLTTPGPTSRPAVAIPTADH